MTVRGETDTLVLTTGRLREDGALPDFAPHVRLGATLAFYMATAEADRIAARMIEAMEMAGVVSSMNTNGSREVIAPGPSRD